MYVQTFKTSDGIQYNETIISLDLLCDGYVLELFPGAVHCFCISHVLLGPESCQSRYFYH